MRFQETKELKKITKVHQLAQALNSITNQPLIRVAQSSDGIRLEIGVKTFQGLSAQAAYCVLEAYEFGRRR